MESEARRVATIAGVTEETLIPGQAAEGSSQRAPGPCYDLGPAWPSTWIEHAAWLDLACPQLGGQHVGT
jgi:hypothetical protein